MSASRLLLLVVLALGALNGCSFAPTWPTTSIQPAPTLAHPGFEESLARHRVDGTAPWRLVVFGDQRALADGEFQTLVGSIAQREQRTGSGSPLVAIVDTGDIVDDGRHADQFAMLSEILEPLRTWPYLVAVGNHELGSDLQNEARANFVQFMGDAPGPLFDRNRLWYRKDAPGLRILFLDTNDWVYGPNEDQSPHRTRQLAWLSAQMSEDFDGRTIVVMHHPIVISNKKHRGQAARMWSIRWNGEVLASMFARGGVDLVITGHTHTYERYRLTSPDGGSFHLVNISGRPRDSFLWIGDGARRARDIRGREVEQLIRVGWRREDVQGWKIEQLDGMFDKNTEENQWAELTIEPDGPLEVEMFFLVDRGAGGYASRGKFTID
jgi:predicted phosphodiesterase